MKSAETARVAELEQALGELVRLKDGPRDDAYRAAKDAAWDAARQALTRRDHEPRDANDDESPRRTARALSPQVAKLAD